MPELIWDGKYDDAGRKVAPPRIVLPFQTVETVNESAQERQRTLDFFAAERPTDWRNRLVWGDNKYVAPALLEDFAGEVSLIYIDPPFATGQDFSFRAQVGDDDFVKEPSVIEQKAYRDMWGKGLDSYIRMMYERLVHMYALLSERGSIYVHLGTNVSQPIKLVLDEIFGAGNFRNEIVWKRATTVKGNFGQGSRFWGPATESIFFYSKTDQYVFHQPYTDYSDNYIDTAYRHIEPETGRRYRLVSMIGPGGKAKGKPSPRPGAGGHPGPPVRGAAVRDGQGCGARHRPVADRLRAQADGRPGTGGRLRPADRRRTDGTGRPRGGHPAVRRRHHPGAGDRHHPAAR